ncbi:MAG TPA: right-handed parallel beta-helix repeat-containing protein [Tepidisphaeraceae bacterium]
MMITIGNTRKIAFSLVLGLSSGAFAATTTGKTLDITSYGAIAGDGKDDTAAIKAAVNAAAAGDTVRIPAGAFDVSSAVSLKSNINFIGAGAAASSLNFSGANSSSFLNLDGVKNVSVSGITLDGKNSTNAAQGVWAQYSSKLTLKDISVKNLGATTGFGPHGVYFVQGVTDSVISGNSFNNIGTSNEWGAGIRVGQGSSRNQILGNTVADTGRGGILCDDNSTDLLIKNNTITGSGKTAEGLGIEVWGGCDRSIIEDNKVDHWLSVDSSNQLAVRRNVVSDKSGVYKWCGIELVDSHDNVFTDNTVDGGAQIGISQSGAKAKERIFWGRNTVKAASTWGIQIQGETGKASKQYFYKNTFAGTMKNDPNTKYAPQGHGFRFNGDSDHIVLDSNKIDGNLGAGIELEATGLSNLSFVGNAITNNGDVAVMGSATDAVWAGNTVAGNGYNNTLKNAAAADNLPDGTLQKNAPNLVGENMFFAINTAGLGSITNVLWDFGEGIPTTQSFTDSVTSASASHVFTEPGVYQVTAIAWNAAGEAAMSEMSVNVTSAVPEPTGLIPAAILISSFGMMTGRRPRIAPQT